VLRNYLLATLRNLARNRTVSVINIVGLAIGIAAALLIALYLRFEYSYESFIPGNERIYRMSIESRSAPGFPGAVWDTGDFWMAEHLRNDYPEIEHSARLVDQWFSIDAGQLEFHEQVYTADPEFFRMVRVKSIAGDPATALDTPDGVVITRTIARKYFGNEPALGKRLEVARSFPLRVTAVIEDLPSNTYFNFRIVASGKAQFSTLGLRDLFRRPGVAFGFHTFFSLRPGADIARIDADMPAFMARHYDADTTKSTIIHIYKLADVHLSPPGRWPMSPPVDPRTLSTLGLVGLLVIVLAIINFVNLMTARATQRATEIGVRKSAGAGRGDIMLQFLGEAFLYVLASMLLGMALVEIVLPWFNAMLDTGEEIYPGATLTFQYWRDPHLAGGLAAAALLLTLLAGAYPAFVMSAFSPAWALKRGAAPGGASHVRQVLVVVQFAALIGLAFATLVIHRQTTFAMNDGLRINRDQVVLLHFNLATGATDGFMDAIKAIPGVRGATGAVALPTNYNISALTFSYAGNPPALLQFGATDYNFFEFYGLKPLAGRLASRQYGTDELSAGKVLQELSVTLNESAARQLGFKSPQDAVGQALSLFGTVPFPIPARFTVAGVVPDFPIDSLRGAIQPSMYFVDTTQRRIVSIRLDGQKIPEALAAIDDVWRRMGEPHAVSRWFLEQYYHRMYLDVLQQRMVLTTLSAVAVFLAVLGLFGLSIYTAQRRTKEIGIRKVMGAGTGNVMALLLWAFSKPVLWASLLAWPVAAWVMSRWLDGFAYRVPLGWWWLPAATLGALAVALLTVSAQSWLVARASPASALRYE
jgi:putative ABC transport system permease protein